MSSFQPFVAGNLGNIAGPGSDGVLVGKLTAANPTAILLKAAKANALCFSDDGGLYVDETVDLASATSNDVPPLPITPAVDDAFYIGHANSKFAEVQLNQTTQGAGVWTMVWEYWNGAAWTALAGVTDGTTGFKAATGFVGVTFTSPTDWAKCTVDGVNGYWVRSRVSAYTSISTRPLIGQGYVVLSSGSYTNDLTDFTSAGAGDVMLLPSTPTVGDGLYIGYSEKFAKIKLTTSQARTGTATIVLKYWNGTEWAAVPTVEDDSIGYSATAGTHLIHFTPPADWVSNSPANGPGGVGGYFVVMELTVLTSVTQQPLATQGWVYPLKTGASGVKSSTGGHHFSIDAMAQTVSGSTGDSKFLVVNCATGASAEFTWTKATGFNTVSSVELAVTKGDQLAIVQVTEDGSTEFANAQFFVNSVEW